MYAENASYRTQKLLNIKTSKINMGSTPFWSCIIYADFANLLFHKKFDRFYIVNIERLLWNHEKTNAISQRIRLNSTEKEILP